ncbi:ABC transporter permease [Paenibacillus sp. NRS-1760]|uniref:ABC transporter permease n=1 Tax=Paenibacillus sp. NRS-1760 TaxID=3233902 RepID=UPI003D296246
MTVTRARKVKQSSKRLICKEVVCKRPVSKKLICKPVRSRKSAFRAVSGIDQNLLDGTTAKVLYQVEELDLNNEYNPANSTFRPKQKGVYALFASVFFQTVTVTTFTLDLEIRVNGVPRISDQEDFTNTSGIIEASGLVQLQARDRVQVFATVLNKNVQIQSGLATRFEGARIN